MSETTLGRRRSFKKKKMNKLGLPREISARFFFSPPFTSVWTLNNECALDSETTYMNVSELSLGEKLSLKGQLFELRKKLNVIDVQNKTTEQYSFKPQLATDYYETPDRDTSFQKNVERAELMRKQKLEMLRATREMEDSAELTFSPAISKKSRSMFSGKKNGDSTLNQNLNSSANSQSAYTSVGTTGTNPNRGKGTDYSKFHRLHDKAAHIQDNVQQKREHFSNYDQKTGQKLFSPRITAKSKSILNSQQNKGGGNGTGASSASATPTKSNGKSPHSKGKVEESTTEIEMNAHDFMYVNM